MKKIVLEKIKNKLIVSTQARVGWPMYGSQIMASFAKAAEMGGACAIRANGKADIDAISERVSIPIMGINKKFDYNCEVYITPTLADVEEIINCKIDLIGIDATKRIRPNNEKLENIINYIKNKNPNLLIVGDISTIDEAMYANSLGIDIIATTLNGYTKQSIENNISNYELIKQLRDKINLPIIAEGKINTPEEAKMMLDIGAYSVVVGTAITRPEIITQHFVQALK